jgi:hypothetical protein
VGNRTAQTVGGVNTTYTVDAADHLLTVNGATVTSDANGSVTQDDTGGLFTWDVRGRFVSLMKGGSNYGFQYGPDGLRLNKSVNGALTTYLLDGGQVVTDTINGTPYQTLYAPGTDHALARNGEFFLPNSLGSTSLLTDGSGNAGQGYQYHPFGELLGGVTDSNPVQYTGQVAGRGDGQQPGPVHGAGERLGRAALLPGTVLQPGMGAVYQRGPVRARRRDQSVRLRREPPRERDRPDGSSQKPTTRCQSRL